MQYAHPQISSNSLGASEDEGSKSPVNLPPAENFNKQQISEECLSIVQSLPGQLGHQVPETLPVQSNILETFTPTEVTTSNSQLSNENANIPQVPMIPADQNYQIPQPPVPESQPIYFSDGVLYPEDLNCGTSNTNGAVDYALPGELIDVYNNLGIVGRLLASGSVATIRFIRAVRNFGENLTGMFGITSPKYEYEINLHNQLIQEEEQRKQKLEQIYGTWQGTTSGIVPVSQPSQLNVAPVAVLPPPVQAQALLGPPSNSSAQYNFPASQQFASLPNTLLPPSPSDSVLSSQQYPVVSNVSTGFTS